MSQARSRTSYFRITLPIIPAELVSPENELGSISKIYTVAPRYNEHGF